MLMAAFFKWWYGEGWSMGWKKLGSLIQSIARAFSVRLLVRTLFSPWRRVVAAKSRGISGTFQAAIDNAVGRFIGFSVRCAVLVTAAIGVVLLAVFGGIFLIVWPLLPGIAIACIVVGALR